MAYEHTNDLIHEKSPYLLQHAHNPVDWHAWNEKTLKLAKREKKPIFLSIGYSTCHWCHVMAHESFEDRRIAAVMNKYFVNIKVDREERPDVDQAFMTAVQAMGQQGGWPLSVWLTPDLKPFFGGTYFPPNPRYGRPGFLEILERIHDLWEESPDAIQSQANNLTRAITEALRSDAAGADLDASVLDLAYQTFGASFDPESGGFGHAPKFPRPTALLFLMRYYHRTGNEDALTMAVQTLRHMALGGIHDHIGGGFARYSVDALWRVPHFEKMLYDQAQLMSAYAAAYQVTNLPDIAAAVYDIAGYVQRDMTDERGGFYSAEDADSMDETGLSREGAFYVWTLEQLEAALGEEAARLVAAYYGVVPEGNFEHGENVLHVSMSIPEAAEAFRMEEETVRDALQRSLARLAVVRAERSRPYRDDKILTSWNGLMISGFSHAYRAVGQVSFLASALRAADFLLETMWDAGKGALMRRYREGEIAIPGFLDDYSFLATGLLDLYEASLDARYLDHAVRITEAMLARFWDEAHGGFFTTETGLAGMARRKEDYDGAEPSGNSAAALLLLRLGETTANPDWRERGERTVRAVSATLAHYPEMMPAMLSALDLMLAAPQQVVIAGEKDADDTRRMLRAVQSRYLPNTSLLLATDDVTVRRLAPWTAAMHPLDGRATAYVCQDFACHAPTPDVDAMAAMLGARRP